MARPPRRRLPPPAGPRLALPLLLALACAAPGPARPGPRAPAAPVGEQAPVPATVPEPESEESAAGEAVEWKRDAEGREYRVEALDRALVDHRQEDGKAVTRWGIVADVEGEDERFVYIRVYRRPEGAGGPRRQAPPPIAGQPGAEPRSSAAAAWPGIPEASWLELAPRQGGLPEPAQWRNAFRLADLDGDGRLDLALPPGRKRFGGPVLLLGVGDGWRRWSEAGLPAVAWDYGDVEVADLDGDGRNDLAFAMHLKGLLVLAQVGPGRFEVASDGLDLGRRSDGGLPFSSRALRSVHLDGDGRLDLVALGEGPRLATGGAAPDPGAWGLRPVRNRGEGAWELLPPLPGSERLFGQTLAVGDVDGDGRRDLLAASDAAATAGMLVLASAEGPRTVGLDLPAGFRVVAPAIGPPEAGGARLALATTGWDGTRWRSTLEVLHPAAGGGWRRETVVTLDGANRLTALAYADLDADGRGDLVVGTDDGALVLLRQRGDEGWVREEGSPLEEGSGCRVYHLEIAVDGDGSVLLAAGRAGERKGDPLLGGGQDGCAGGGDLHVWSVSPRGPGPPGGALRSPDRSTP